MISHNRGRGVTAASLAVLLMAAGPTHLCGQITAGGVGGFRLCDTLARVNSVFPSARDTTTTDAERSAPLWGRTEPSLSGPARVVWLTRREWVLFETEYPDTIDVWRIRTNSATYRTPHGYGVGMSATDLLKDHAHLEILAPIGVFYLVADSVTFLVDDSSAKRFWDHFDAREFESAAMKHLRRNARIKELLIASPCEP